MRVNELSEAEQRRVIGEINGERKAEYAEIRAGAQEFLARSRKHPGPKDDYGRRRRTERELLALQRRFRKVRDRDHFEAPGRVEAAAAIDRCLRYRQGISAKLTSRTDSHHEAGD